MSTKLSLISQKDDTDKTRRSRLAFNVVEEGTQALHEAHGKGPATDVAWDSKLNRLVVVYNASAT